MHISENRRITEITSRKIFDALGPVWAGRLEEPETGGDCGRGLSRKRFVTSFVVDVPHAREFGQLMHAAENNGNDDEPG